MYNGDCLDIMRCMPSEIVDLTVTSPPYDNLRSYNGNIEQWNFEKFKAIAKELYRVTNKGGVVVWVVADATIKGSETGTSFKQALYFKKCGFNLHDTMIFAKLNYPPQTHRRYEQAFEYMFVFSKGKPNTFNPLLERCKTYGKLHNYKKQVMLDEKQIMRQRDERRAVKEFKRRNNIFAYTVGGGRTGHPAPFPLQLAQDHITTWTKEGDLVLDVFLGSGTTGVAAVKSGRKFIGVEIEKEYFEKAKQRIKSEAAILTQ